MSCEDCCCDPLAAIVEIAGCGCCEESAGPDVLSPEDFGLRLRAYWDGRDLTPASGTADPWVPRGGDQGTNLLNVGSAATITTVGSFRGVVGRMQTNAPGYVIDSEEIIASYVFVMPTANTLRGVSAYLGKPLPLIFGFSAANRFEVARGTVGTGFETPVLLVNDVSSWVGQTVSIVVKMTTGSISVFWSVGGVENEATVLLAGVNWPPEGWTLGGFADSGGDFGTAFFESCLIDGATDEECRKLARWGALTWS